MAAGLAASVREHFGIAPELVEGHNGIFQVRLEGKVLFDNDSKCRRLPVVQEVLWELQKHLEPLEGKRIPPPLPMVGN